MLTPEVVHHGEVNTVVARRNTTLAEADGRHPERFSRGEPVEHRRPTEAWINPPANAEAATLVAH